MSAVISCENETLPAKSIDKEAAFSDLIHLIKARRNDFQKLSHVPRDVVNAMKRARYFPCLHAQTLWR